MVQFQYVGCLSERSLLCVSVSEAASEDGWEVQTHLLLLSQDGRSQRIELACASFANPLDAVEEAVELSRSLEAMAKERAIELPGMKKALRRAVG